MAQPRNSIFDLLRVFLTVFVINIHMLSIYRLKYNELVPYTWYTVPLFVVLSFYFVSSKPLSERLKRLFIPFIFWSIVGFIIHPNLVSINNILTQFITGHVVNFPLYYLALLIYFTVINWIINKYFSRYQKIVFCLIIISTLFLEYSKINFNYFILKPDAFQKCFGRFTELIIFVPIGLTFAYLKKNINNKNIFLLLSIFFLMAFFVVSRIPVPSDFHFSGLKIMTGSITIFSLTIWLSHLKFNDRFNNIISSIGRYSFGVYLFHFLLLEILLQNFPQTKFFITHYQLPFLFSYVIFCYFFCYIFDLLTFNKFSYLLK